MKWKEREKEKIKRLEEEERMFRKHGLLNADWIKKIILEKKRRLTFKVINGGRC